MRRALALTLAALALSGPLAAQTPCGGSFPAFRTTIIPTPRSFTASKRIFPVFSNATAPWCGKPFPISTCR